MRKYFLLISLLQFSLFSISQVADFTFQSDNGVFCNPTTVRFSQNCTGNPIGFIWNFGNNTKAYSGNVSTTYSNVGSYTVKLTAIYAQSTVEVSKIIVINPTIVSSIGFDRNYICTPGPINFSASSNGSKLTYTWDFGDLSVPVNSATPLTPHTYSNFGAYTVNLKVTDTTGCSGVASTNVQLTKPPITVSVSPQSGCIPADVGFNGSVVVPSNDFVTKYTWNFGDGSPVSTGGNANINHQYTSVGTFNPTLDIATNDGCTNSYNIPSVAYGTPPTNHVAYPKKTIVCGSETPDFVSKAVNANGYVWDFGDGTGRLFVLDTVTQHKFSTLGFKTVSVTPYFNDCSGTTISFQIEVVGVISSYTFLNSCSNRNTYTFTNFAQGNVTSNLWTFGDSSYTDTVTNPTHSYPAQGNFIAYLRVTDSVTGCTDTYGDYVYTARPSLINTDSSICRNSISTFTLNNNYSNPSSTYTWSVLGTTVGPTSAPSLSVNGGTLGSFNNFVVVKYGPQSCPDTILLNHPIVVKGPDLNFTTPPSSCFNSTTSITNLSHPFIRADSVLLWAWNYGNSASNDTIYQPKSFVYANPGSYDIKLIAFDINGCKDSLTKTTVVNPNPFLLVLPKIDTLCQGQSDTLRSFASDPVLWSPGTGISCTNCDSAIANPISTTLYSITSTNSFNCVTRDSILVKVYSPFTAVAAANNSYICLNDQAVLDVSPKLKRVTWSPPASLSGTTIYNPVATPLTTTTYTATLIDSVGCFSSTANISVFVKSLPTVNAGPDRILPYNSNFTITPVYSSNVSQYAWSPSTGLQCNNCANPSGTALRSETYLIKVTSDSGCIATDDIAIFIECKNANLLLPSAFTPNNDNLNDMFYPITRGIKTILKFAIFNREGHIIYEASNFTPNNKTLGWNGDFKGQPQSPGAYVYILEALCEIGEKITKSGSLLLLR